MILRKLLYVLTRGLIGYLIFFTLLAAWYHSDVLWNMYNYGRHWDWTFFSVSDIYSQFIYRFFYSYKQNSLGYFDIISVSFIDVAVKFVIYGLFTLFNSHTIVTLTIPILNKMMVFMVFPIATSLGVWMACKKILSDLYEENRTHFMLVAVFCNLIYTFSFLLILDLHGGALNRQISSVFFPWFFYLLFDYWECKKPNYFDHHILLLSLMFAVSDISNMFFFGVLITLYIFIKEIPWKKKLAHFVTLVTAVALFNMYWLHAFVIGGAMNTTAILTERKIDFTVLTAYSATYTDILFMLNSAHNLIRRMFGLNPLLYVPFFFLYMGILRALFILRVNRKLLRLYVVLFLGYLFITILTNGVYSIGKIYVWLYSFDMLAFIRAAIRYMPNLAAYSIFLFLVTYRIKLKESTIKLSREYIYLCFPIAVSLFVLLTNTHMISLIQDRVVKDAEFNQDVGSLYEYNPSFIAATRREKLEYNVLPVPSWFSPIFVDNIYPRTSQGSDTDNLYVPHPVINTNGVPLFSTQVIEAYTEAEPDPYFYSITNTKYVWFKTTEVYAGVKPGYYFSDKWILQADPANRSQLKKIRDTNGAYQVPKQFFVPVVYIPQQTMYSDITMRQLPHVFEKAQSTPASIYLANQNEGKRTKEVKENAFNTEATILEFKKINPTKYRIVLHHAQNTVPIVLSYAYYPGWKLYVVPHKKGTFDTDRYAVLPGNSNDQATKDELQQYINSGWISTVGDMKEKRDRDVIFNGSREQIYQTKPYVIDFISKNIKGTIQNNNLTDGSFMETWNKSITELPETRHLQSNGFSNSWVVPVGELCKGSSLCLRQNDGSYDVEFVAEFKPQRYYFISIFISLASLIAVIVYVSIYSLLSKHET